MRLRAAAAAFLLGVLPPGGTAAQIPTPEARDFIIEQEEEKLLVVGFSAHLIAGQRIGVVAICTKASRELELRLSFGNYPDGRNVQTAVRSADGSVARFGPVVRGSRSSGFHSPDYTSRDDTAGLLERAFSEGALISNGYNSIWNRIPQDQNAAARKRLKACAGL